MRVETNGNSHVTIVVTPEGAFVEAFQRTERVVIIDGVEISREIDPVETIVNTSQLRDVLPGHAPMLVENVSLKAANAELEGRVAFLEAQALSETEAAAG